MASTDSKTNSDNDFHFLIERLNFNFSISSEYEFEKNDLEEKRGWETKEIQGRKYFLAAMIIINKDGLIVIDNKLTWQATYSPKEWSKHTCKELDNWKLFDLEAVEYIQNFESLSQHIKAKIRSDQLSKPGVYYRLLENEPELIDYPIIKNRLHGLLKTGWVPTKSERCGGTSRNSKKPEPYIAELMFQIKSHQHELEQEYLHEGRILELTEKHSDKIKKEAIIFISKNSKSIPPAWGEDFIGNVKANKIKANLRSMFDRYKKHPFFSEI